MSVIFARSLRITLKIFDKKQTFLPSSWIYFLTTGRNRRGSFHVKTANFQKNSYLTLSDFAETSSKWGF